MTIAATPVPLSEAKARLSELTRRYTNSTKGSP